MNDYERHLHDLTREFVQETRPRMAELRQQIREAGEMEGMMECRGSDHRESYGPAVLGEFLCRPCLYHLHCRCAVLQGYADDAELLAEVWRAATGEEPPDIEGGES